jgi:TonB family protein
MIAAATPHIVFYALQIFVVVVMATLADWAFGARAARGRLTFWRAVVAACLVLPMLPALPWLSPTALSLQIGGLATFTSRAAGATVATGPSVIAIPLLLGALTRGAYLACGVLRLRSLRATSTPIRVDTNVENVLRRLAPRAGLASHPQVQQPVTFGVRRPLILVPPHLVNLPPGVQRSVVLHEAFHVLRHDWLQLIAEQVVRAVFWFHPAIWWAIDRVQLAREQRVDELVVEATGERQIYMNTLLSFGDLPAAPVAATFLGRHHLSHRIRALASPRPRSLVRDRCAAAFLVVTVLTATMGATSLHSLQDDASKESVFEPGNGVTLPIVVREVQPQYTDAAKQDRIEGTVLLSCVVTKAGKVDRIAVDRSLDKQFGLDDAAVTALTQWAFKPGTKDGQPVVVRIHVEMTFTLK